MKRTLFFATLLLSAITLLTTSCGTSDSIKSLLLSSATGSASNFYNLSGQDGTVQLKVYAVYNSGKQIDVTTSATFSVNPVGCASTTDQANTAAACPNGTLPPYGPTTVPINKTGLMTGIAGLCTWTDLLDSTGKPQTPPSWAYTGYYQTTASYRGFTSQPVAIGVGVTISNSPTGGCGPA